jgi:hypothetical protein
MRRLLAGGEPVLPGFAEAAGALKVLERLTQALVADLETRSELRTSECRASREDFRFRERLERSGRTGNVVARDLEVSG